MKGNALSAHIGYLFSKLPLEKRVPAARKAGFDAVEHPSPFALSAKELRKQLNDEGMSFSQLAGGAGDASRGEKGLAALAGRAQDFRASFLKALDYAEEIDCPFIHPMAGVASDRVIAGSVYRDNIAFAVEACRGRGPSVLIEAISRTVVPDYFMGKLDDAVAISNDFEPGEISILLDTYHAAAEGIDAGAFIAAHGGRLGHIHIADHPGRHQPGTGNIDFAKFLSGLSAAGFSRAIGFEYIPEGETLASLGWLPEWKARLANHRPAALA
ncbi:TIM barrel protein [Mesorhizobium sp. SB112]|uniref:hydroxypyruvate isomerase family protein n=1 Tax=Mesorhizobium sp. SB112 TaxID=3151853 RepID=UPI0032666D35